MELAVKEILESGDIYRFEKFFCENREQIDVKHTFDEGVSWPMILVQTYRKAESLKIDRSTKILEEYKQCMKILYEIGCDLNAKDSMGRTIAHWSIMLHCLELLSFGLELGCDPLLQDLEGETIVHLAIRYNDQMALEAIKLYANNVNVFEMPSETSGATPLIYAVQIEAVDTLKKLLQLSVNVDAQENNKYKRTALHYALFIENEEIFTLLLKHKAKCDIKDYTGKTVIDRACDHPKDNFLRILTHYSSAEIFSSSLNNSNSTTKYSPIILACLNGDFSMLCGLIDEDPDISKTLNVLVDNIELRTPLHYCADNSDTKCSEKLIELQPKIIGKKDKNGFTVLHLATISNNIKLVRMLIDKGCDAKEKDNDGHTCLHWAVVCCAIDLIDIFLKTDSDIQTIVDNYGGSPLHYATQSFLNPEGATQGPIILEKLLEAKCNINCIDCDERTPLLWAASLGITSCCQIFMENQADISHRDNNGLSMLHCAASRGHYDIVDFAVNKWSMPVDVEDNNRCTPLFYAVTLRYMPIVNFFLEKGSNPNKQDIKGRTIAHCAALKGYCDILDLICKSGGLLTLKNKNGDLPLHEAAETGKLDVCRLILQRMEEGDESHMINSLNNSGFSPLHKAAQNNHYKICQLLIENGADVNLLTKPDKIDGTNTEANLRPIDLATDIETINLLKDLKRTDSKVPHEEYQQYLYDDNREISESQDKPSSKPQSSGSSISVQSKSSNNSKSISSRENKNRLPNGIRNIKNISINIKSKTSMRDMKNEVSETNGHQNILQAKSDEKQLVEKLKKLNILMEGENENESRRWEKVLQSSKLQKDQKEMQNSRIDTPSKTVNVNFNKHDSNDVKSKNGLLHLQNNNTDNNRQSDLEACKSSVRPKSSRIKSNELDKLINHSARKEGSKFKFRKLRSELDLLETGVDFKPFSYNSNDIPYFSHRTNGRISYFSDQRKPFRIKSKYLSSKVVDSVKEFERVRDTMRSISDQRRMEMYQGYDKTVKFNKIPVKKTTNLMKPKQDEQKSNYLELPSLQYVESYLVENQNMPKRRIFSISQKKEDQIRSAYDCRTPLDSFTLY